MDLYDTVKELFLLEIAKKASWGKNEIKTLLLECEVKVSRDLLREKS